MYQNEDILNKASVNRANHCRGGGTHKAGTLFCKQKSNFIKEIFPLKVL